MHLPNPTTTRRRFLEGSVATAGALAVTSSVLGTGPLAHVAGGLRPAGAAEPAGRLVQVFLRGGQDGLSVAVPHAESAYYAARPAIAIPSSVVLDLDGQFGLHPALVRLHALHQDGRLAVVVGAGNPAGNRSHFTAQDLWEYGATEVPIDGHGWLARYLDATATTEDSAFRGLTLGNNVNLSLRGYPALGLASIHGFGLGGQSGATTELGDLFQLTYAGEAPIEVFGRQALDAANAVGDLDGSNANNDVTRAFADIAELLDSDLGVEVVTTNIGGWDTHAGMGDHTAGEMRALLTALDSYLADFQDDLDARGLDDVTTVVLTEFGRRVAQNGAEGTEHGWGMVMLVLGGRVQGGVHGDWAGLDPGTIGPRGDVVVTTDFRDVLGDIARDVLSVADPSSLFPDHAYTPVGVTA